MSEYVTWDALIEKMAAAGFYIERSLIVSGPKHNGLKLYRCNLPVSISELEFNVMHDIIIKNNCRSIYELSTGLGISTLALTLAARGTHGRVISFDSYAEEATQVQPMGTEHSLKGYQNSKCYRNAVGLVETFGVSSLVDLCCGWSPTDTVPALQTFTQQYGKLDFVFFDCPKDDADFQRDLSSVVPFLADKYIICIHDTHCYSAEANRTAIKLLGVPYHHILTKSQFYPLAMLTNHEDIELYRNI